MYKKNSIKTRTPEQALETLKWMCSKSEKTKKSCVESLYRWHVEKEEHEAIIDTLVQDKFIDERRYTTMFISEKHNLYKWGRIKIFFTLKTKGVPLDTISEVYDELVEPKTIELNLLEIMKKKAEKIMTNTPDVNEYNLKVKLFRWASSRGYDYDDICSATEKILTEIGNN